MTQLDTTLTGTALFRRTTSDAGETIAKHGSAFSRSRRDPDREVTALAQMPASTDRASAANMLSLRTNCTLAAVAITASQQPKKTPSNQAWGAGKIANRFSFNGASRIECGNDLSLRPRDAITVTAWIKTTQKVRSLKESPDDGDQTPDKDES